MKYLSDYMNQAQTEAFNKFGAFFAFGSKQFEEKCKPGVRYVDMGAGLVCPKESAKLLNDALENIYQQAIKADVSENGAAKIVEREYFNHETQLTGDTFTMMEALSGHIEAFPELFTQELIHSTCRSCFALAVKHDWF